LTLPEILIIISQSSELGGREMRKFISMVAIAMLIGAGLFAGGCILDVPSAVADPN
jgi:hypothetical protein